VCILGVSLDIHTLFERLEVLTGGNNEECSLLGCYTAWLLQDLTFQRNVSLP
jgi:hypothetical protein